MSLKYEPKHQTLNLEVSNRVTIRRSIVSGGLPEDASLEPGAADVPPPQVYEPYIRALLGTASHFCEVVVLKLTYLRLIDLCITQL